jgi:hypothetical protein
LLLCEAKSKIKQISALELFFVSECVCVGYHSEKAYWLVEFQENDTCGEIYRRIMDDIISFLNFRPASKIIIDQSKKSFFRAEDVLWAWQSWLPLFSKCLGQNGKMAMILPASKFTFIEKTSLRIIPFQNKVFTTRKEAESWLLA